MPRRRSIHLLLALSLAALGGGCRAAGPRATPDAPNAREVPTQGLVGEAEATRASQTSSSAVHEAWLRGAGPARAMEALRQLPLRASRTDEASRRAFEALALGDVAAVLRAVDADPRLLDLPSGASGETLLARAAAMDLVDLVDSLLERGAAVLPPRSHEHGVAGATTPLHAACSQRVAERLLGEGADPERLDGRGLTPLRHAALLADGDDGARVRALIAAGVRADLESLVRIGAIDEVCDALASSEERREEARRDPHVLCAAAHLGDPRLVRALLACGVSARSAAVPREGALNRRAESALTFAVRGGHVEVARLLLAAGADARGGFGWPEQHGFHVWNGGDGDLLCRAIDDGCVDLVRLLVRHGADFESGPSVAPPTSFTRIGTGDALPLHERSSTPLGRAAFLGHEECARALLDAGAAPNQPSEGMPPIFHAAFAGHEHVARLLRDHGATVDVWSAAALGWTEDVARHARAAPALLDAAEAATGATPLQLALEFGRADVLDVLVAHGARLDRPLTGPEPWVERLLHSGSFPRVLGLFTVGRPPRSAVAYAVEAGRIELAIALVRHGAPVQEDARRAALRSGKREAFDLSSELAARGLLRPSTREEGHGWLVACVSAPGVRALDVHSDERHRAELEGPLTVALLRPRLALLQGEGGEELEPGALADEALGGWHPRLAIPRARLLLELGFALEPALRLLARSGPVPAADELERVRATFSSRADWFQALPLPAALVGDAELLRALATSGPPLHGHELFQCALAAVGERHDSAVGVLLELGVPLEGNVGAEQRSLLHAAASADAPAIVRRLVARGAAASARDPRGTTPLHEAAAATAVECAAVLLAAGADPNVRDGRGRTPLHVAAPAFSDQDEGALRRRHDFCALLLSHGADRSARDVSGERAVDVLRYVWRYPAFGAPGAPLPAQLVDLLSPEDTTKGR